MIISVAALQPAAPPPSSQFTSANEIPSPPPLTDPFQPTILDDALLSVFRCTLQQQQADLGARQSDLPGFDGMVQELLDFRQLHGLDEQERVSYQTMMALAGPVPFIYKHLVGNAEFTPGFLATCAKYLLPFLVGDMTLTTRSSTDQRPGGVLVERCRVLEGTQCKGICTKMCKIPTQRFFQEEWGVPLQMTPNFETGQCQLTFGVEPLPVEDDPTLPEGCLTRCPAANFPSQSTMSSSMHSDNDARIATSTTTTNARHIKKQSTVDGC